MAIAIDERCEHLSSGHSEIIAPEKLKSLFDDFSKTERPLSLLDDSEMSSLNDYITNFPEVRDIFDEAEHEAIKKATARYQKLNLDNEPFPEFVGGGAITTSGTGPMGLQGLTDFDLLKKKYEENWATTTKKFSSKPPGSTNSFIDPEDNTENDVPF